MGIRHALLLALLCACSTGTPNSGDDTGGGTSDAGGSGSGSGGGGELDVTKSGSRIKMRVVNSGDGAKAFQGFYDSQRHEDCNFQVASDGVTRSLPTSILLGGGSYFADANCTIPAGFYFSGCTSPTYLSVPPATATCPIATTVGPSIYATGTSIASYYSRSGATCTGPQTISAGYTMYTSTGGPTRADELPGSHGRNRVIRTRVEPSEEG